MTTPDRNSLLTAQDIAVIPEVHIRHPWNDKSDVYIKRLSALAGLSRIGVTLARVPPGKESFVYHSHERDEEFLFIVSGRGLAEIGEATFEVGPGDFMGFTAPGIAHHLTNPFHEDLVYLMGGERSGFDVGYFPKLKRRLVFSRSGIHAAQDADLEAMTLDDFIVKS